MGQALKHLFTYTYASHLVWDKWDKTEASKGSVSSTFTVSYGYFCCNTIGRN